jgi:Domain of unknown function (DUF5063)
MIEKIQKDVLAQFAHTAEAYCRLLETHTHLSDEAFTEQCAAALATIYRDALALPESHTLPKLDHNCDETQPVYETDFAHPLVRALLTERFTAHNVDLHWLYADPFDPESSLTVRVSDDLNEIYVSLRKGLALYQLATDCALLYAAFEWQFGFISHWGSHLAQALPALHQIIMDDQRAKLRAAAQERGDARAD